MKSRDLVTTEQIDMVRTALRSGRATEKAIKKYTGLAWYEVAAALRILKHHGEVESNDRPEKYRGIVLSTMSYRQRRARDLVEPRSHRGRPRVITYRMMRDYFG